MLKTTNSVINASQITGTLPVANGGTGLTSLTANYIPYGNGTSAFNSSSNLTWNGSNFQVNGGLINNQSGGYSQFTPSIGALTGAYGSNNTASFYLSGGTGNNGNQVGHYINSVMSSNGGGGGTASLQIGTLQWTGSAFSVLSEQIRLFSSGGVSIGNTTDPGAGNLRFNTTGTNGIYFGSSSKLADYEEGTWTPNQGGSVSVVGAYTSSGTYTKIGNLVTITAIQNGATSIAVSASGQLFTNAPYTVNSSGSRYSGITAPQFSGGSSGAIAIGGTTNVYATGTLSGISTIVTTITYQV